MSGGGEIRTRERPATSPVFKTDSDSPQPLTMREPVESDAPTLATHLALWVQKAASLALVIDHWAMLPEPIRQGIVAMVEAAARTAAEPVRAPSRDASKRK